MGNPATQVLKRLREGIALSLKRAVAAGAVLAATIAPTAAQAAPELSVSDRLQDRRYVESSERAYVVGFEDGYFYGQGWHITGEMGGVWTPPLKLVDGVWFSVDDQWVGRATQFTSGYGYARMRLPDTAGLGLERVDFAPDGRRAVLIGLKVTNPGTQRTVRIDVEAASELIGQYPWAWTTPNAGEFNLPDTGAYADGALVFREDGKPHANAAEHHWAALVAANATPTAGVTGDGFRGPPAQEGLPECGDPPGDPLPPRFCDDGPFGKGTSGRLTYQLTVPANGSRTLWVAVAGSDEGLAEARAELQAALADPAAALARKIAARERKAARTRLSLPGDPRLAEAIDWGKQNILDLTQAARDLEIRDVDEGRDYPPPAGRVAGVRFVGAGFPDYEWMFATDGEYTAFASVTVGQFEAIKDHARGLRDVSLILNGNTGKVVHEIMTEGSVYFGDLEDPGNTDETAKFPSLVALIWRWTGDHAFLRDLYPFTVRNMRYVVEELDEDGDGWPEGRGNVERGGMGEEKLDNTVYTIRGLYDLADMAKARGDARTFAWAKTRARYLHRRFEDAWWMPQVPQHADSLDTEPVGGPNDQQQDRHWIGVTPMEAELTVHGRAVPGLTTYDHGTAALALRETECYSGTRPYNEGLFHTGRSGCDGWPEQSAGETSIFTLNTAIQAVGEGNYGRLGPRQQRRYTDANAETMLPVPDEQPGAMPEIAPSPGFDPAGNEDRNIDRCTICRSMVMQAWGNYGTMWAVVHQQLGVRPDLGRGRLAVVPQLPSTAPIAGRDIRLGNGELDLVAASRDGNRYRTTVDAGDAPIWRLRIGHTLPHGASVRSVWLDGRRTGWQARRTNRGLEVTVESRRGEHTLVVEAR
jgi:hypothetical protein